MTDGKSVENRYDFLMLFDVKDGNPNGDPDAGNLPRMDAETGHGLVTDVSLKRKIRNYVEIAKGDVPPYKIFIKEKAVLNSTIEKEGYAKVGIDVLNPNSTNEDDKYIKTTQDQRDRARKHLCQNFYDIRTFGAVMTTGPNAGQVRGPVQLTFARSVEPIRSLEHSITRVAVTTEKESVEQSGGNRTMGRKSTVPYGLYRAYGFVSAPLANQTGFTETDLNLLFEALASMFESDRSAARGMMSTRKLFVFKHSSKLGNAPAQELFDTITVKRNDESNPPRDFSDYTISIDRSRIPDEVTLIERM